MKLLQKVLLVAMACVFVGNIQVTAAVLDLPEDTPGLQTTQKERVIQGDTQIIRKRLRIPRRINGILELCEHIIIQSTTHNLYFPKCGPANNTRSCTILMRKHR